MTYETDRLWPLIEDSKIAVVKDGENCLHAPDGDNSERGICGVTGVYEERPATHAGVWCTTCLRDAGAIP